MSPAASDTYERLRDEIVTWRLPPRAAMKEEEIALRLGVSRTPVREALAQLRRDRLVVQEPGAVAAVASLGLTEVVQMFQARDALEVRCVQLCALSPRREAFASLAQDYRACLAALQRGDEAALEGVYILGDRFEEEIDRVAGNPFLSEPREQILVGFRRLRWLAVRNPARLAQAARQRLAVAEAIVDGDATAAAKATHERLQASLEHALETLASDVGSFAVTPPLRA